MKVGSLIRGVGCFLLLSVGLTGMNLTGSVCYGENRSTYLNIQAGVEAMAPQNAADIEAALQLIDRGYIEFLVKYGKTAVAVVDGYVNVRESADITSAIVGKVYDGSAVTIIEPEADKSALGADIASGGESDTTVDESTPGADIASGDESDTANYVIGSDGTEWYHIASGTVDGYVKPEYFIKGEELYHSLDEYLYRYAVVNASDLNVRSGPGEGYDKIAGVQQGKKYEVLEQQNGFVCIYYSADNSGWVAGEYVTVGEEFFSAVSIEEEQRAAAEKEAEEQAKRDLEAKEKAEREAALAAAAQTEAGAAATTQTEMGMAAGNQVITDSQGDTAVGGIVVSDDKQEVRQQVVDYAMQYLGYPYKHGGTSLEATDCSGFTCFIYAEFGYAIDRTPSGQYQNAGTSISYDQIQKGDIICYGNGSKITHVALYIGDGMIIHEANSRKGVVIYEADYDDIVGVRNVIG